jgi:hypothetical protein
MVFGRFIFLYGTDRAETIPGCPSTFIPPYSGLEKILLIILLKILLCFEVAFPDNV